MTLTLDELGALRGEIDVTDDVTHVLRTRDLDPAAFAEAEARLLEAIADALDRGDPEPLQRYRLAYERVRGAQSAAGAPVLAPAATDAFDGTAAIDIGSLAAALNAPLPFTREPADDPMATAHLDIRTVLAGLKAAQPFGAAPQAPAPSARPVVEQSGETEELDVSALRASLKQGR